MIIRADSRAIPLADGCVQTCVTSPPYWGLRDYGVSGQIGVEATPEEYVATMVSVFREVRRVLRDDGPVWLNLGDSYCSGATSTRTPGNGAVGGWRAEANLIGRNGTPDGLKPKDLCGIPWRVAFALQADGWYLRSDIIWAKPNPMPESVTDRPTRSHEYIFLLSKRERYFYDADAIRESAITEGDRRFERTDNTQKYARNGDDSRTRTGTPTAGRNKRSVWTVNSEPTPEAHFATFPQKLIEPCILAGTSEKGCCAECGAPRVRVTEREAIQLRPNSDSIRGHSPSANRSPSGPQQGARSVSVQTTGWRASCAHDAPSVPCLVLDPFLGSGTVGRVCERLGRRWVGLELSAEYIAIAENRTAQMGLQL